MRLSWEPSLTLDVDVAGLDAAAAVARVLATDAGRESILALATGSARRVRAGAIDEAMAAFLARTAIDSGKEAAVAALFEHAGIDLDALRNDAIRSAFRKPDSFLSSLRDALDREFDEDISEIVDILREGVRSGLEAALSRSVCASLGKRAAVEARFECAEAGGLSFSGPKGGIATVEADEAVSTLMTVANADVGAFFARASTHFGVDLRSGDGNEALLEFLAGHSFGYSREGSKAAARLWRRLSPACDQDRDPALTSDDLIAVLDKSPRGAVPAVVARVSLAELLDQGIEGVLGDGAGVFVGTLVPGSDDGFLLRARAGLDVASLRGRWSVEGESAPDDPEISLPGYR